MLGRERVRGVHVERIYCPACGLGQPLTHHFCVACGTALPVHLLPDAERPVKRARFFAGVPVDPSDPETGFLRVTCYRKEQVFQSQEASVTIPGRHVRFSIWTGDEARCALSIPESEARSLAAFLEHELDQLERSS